MTFRSIQVYVSLIKQFRNALTLIRGVRSGIECDTATTWSGRSLTHPPGRSGFLDGLLEHWVFETYRIGQFYNPAPGDVVLDIGANIGLFSIQLARKWQSVRVLAFEPSPVTFLHLKTNLNSFDCINVAPYQVALGKKREFGAIVPGSRSLDDKLQSATAGPSSFLIVPLKEILRMTNTDRIALMKVDIEGSEKQAFEEVTPEDLSRIDKIILEYHDNILPGCLETVSTCLRHTHKVSIEPSTVKGCGLLRATRLA